MKLITHIVLAFFYFFAVLPFLSPVYADSNFKTDYHVKYFVTDAKKDEPTRVSFHIKITNLVSDEVIREFSILFPKSFQIGNIKAHDDFSDITAKVSEEANKTVVSMRFSDPKAGLQTENNLYLDFLQYNLFKSSGLTWEVILPTVERDRDKGSYTVSVSLPPNSGKQLGISKPKPNHVTLNEVTWINPENRTIYAVFDKQQNYHLQLRYHLTNPRLTRVYTDIAFPPDSLYQKVFIEAIKPFPDVVYSDEDGNFMGRYFLNPRETKTIVFTGGVEIYVEPRLDVETAMKKMIYTQRKYLLSEADMWIIDDASAENSLNTVQDIYRFVKDTLTYNYGRLNSTITRLGSKQALQYPDQAVCTEYSDVFISMAREQGIYAREIQGYGFSNDQELRPLSVNQDILHSWVEYYDLARNIWVPLDPTWEDTSGIDYLSSFDLNHVVFAIHGKKADYPYPAGSYKNSSDTKDININPTESYFVETKSISTAIHSLQIPTSKQNTFSTKITFRNNGNTVLWNYELRLDSDDVVINPSQIETIMLLPGEKVEKNIEYVRKQGFTKNKANIAVYEGDTIIGKHEIVIPDSLYIKVGIGLTAVILGGIIIIIMIKSRK